MTEDQERRAAYLNCAEASLSPGYEKGGGAASVADPWHERIDSSTRGSNQS